MKTELRLANDANVGERLVDEDGNITPPISSISVTKIFEPYQVEIKFRGGMHATAAVTDTVRVFISDDEEKAAKRAKGK